MPNLLVEGGKPHAHKTLKIQRGPAVEDPHPTRHRRASARLVSSIDALSQLDARGRA